MAAPPIQTEGPYTAPWLQRARRWLPRLIVLFFTCGISGFALGFLRAKGIL